MLMTDTPRNRWLPEDKQELIYNWDRLGSVFLISVVMNRPKGAIQTEASRIGLPRRDPAQGRHRRKWTPEEVENFWATVEECKDGFGRIDILQVADKTERPIDVVATRLQDLFPDEKTLRENVVIPKDVFSRIALLRKKQGSMPMAPKFKSRQCLCCSATFLSEGSGNRICQRCKDRM